MNNIIVMGRLTKDPEVLTTKTNKKYIKFTVAESTSKDNTNFFDCLAFGKTAKFISEYFHKGDPIYVSGNLQIEKTKKDDKYYTNITLTVRDVSFTISKNNTVTQQGTDDKW